MQLSDYIIDFLEQKGVKHAFLLTGGGAMHMNNSLGKSEKISYTACLHEQAAGIAAEAYARVTNTPGFLLVTSGPGATNAITPVCAAWIESTPVFVLSGQVKRADMINNQGIRQMGMQEVDTVSMVKSITKYVALVDDPLMIKYHLEKAWHEATTGRPGPVWLDVPLDVQAWDIDVENLNGFDVSYRHKTPTDAEVNQVSELLKTSKRPCLMLGNGIRLSGAAGEVDDFVNKLGIPVLTTWNGIDLIDDEHPYYIGRPGGVGQRAATVIQQNCDLLITIGARLNLLQTGYNYDAFVRAAKHIMVDIDPYELKKINVHPYLSICCNAGEFMRRLVVVCGRGDRREWWDYCGKVMEKYPVMMREYKSDPWYVNSFEFIRALSESMTNDDVYVCTSSGSALDVSMTVFKIKKGQRAFSTKGLASMGFDIPACVGACIASGGKRTVCVTGDGSFQMNVQELETIARLNLPIKLFVINNDGYALIRNSHMGAFNGRLTACTPESGLTLPDVLKQAQVYGIRGELIDETFDLQNISGLIDGNGPLICKVKVDIAQKLIPRQTSYRNKNGQMESLPLEEMVPRLSDEEMEEIMLIPRWDF